MYSFGIGEDLSFSQDLLKRWNCDIYAFDPTPKAIAYVRQSHLGAQDNFHFYEWGISDRDGTGQFHLPKEELYVPEALVGDSRVEEVSGSVIPHDGVQCETIDVEFRTLKTIMKQLNHQQIDLLKMDIEGFEWEVFANCSRDIMNRFDQIVMEVHSLTNMEKADIIVKALQNIANTHQIVHIHPNNIAFVSHCGNLLMPDTLELTFVKKDIFQFEDCDVFLPIDIDMPGIDFIPEIKLGYWNRI